MALPAYYRRWPNNPTATEVVFPTDALQWSSVPSLDGDDPRLLDLPLCHLESLTESHHFRQLSAEVQAAILDKLGVESANVTLLPNASIDLTSRARAMEELRAQIPADQLLKVALTAVATGRLPGGEVIRADQRAKIMMSLIDKTLPHAKNVDAELVAERATRAKLAKKAETQEEISKLSRDELERRILELEG